MNNPALRQISDCTFSSPSDINRIHNYLNGYSELDNDINEQEVFDTINSIAVTENELLNAWHRLESLPQEYQNLDSRQLALIQMFHSQHEYKSLAVQFRLEAMCRIIQSDKLPEWVVKDGPNGAIHLSDGFWRAVASEPVILVEQRPLFDFDSFMNALLLHADECGSA